jgi:hypothetical protein
METMRKKTQHIENQPLRHNSLTIIQLGFNKTLTKKLGYLSGFWVLSIEGMREKTQHIDNQPLTHNQLVINQLCNVDKMWITLPFMIR